MEDDHVELWVSETFVTNAERLWMSWIDALEKHVGHDLDGTQVRDGFSLDHCFKMWGDGLTVPEAARIIEHNKAIVAMSKEAPCC